MAPRGPKNITVRPTKGVDSWEGLLSLHPRGFGFVNAAGQDDVFIPPEAVGAAMHGDRVIVLVTGGSSRGLEGRIERIVSRRNPRIAGVLRRRGKSAWLEPDDSRVRGPIVLAMTREGKDGDAAVAIITRFPEYTNENPEGELVNVLGTPGDPNVEVAKILVREQVTEEHPDAAVREAETMAARIRPLQLDGRVDLRHVPLPTIDPEDARDHDDAVWVERHGDGYRAYVAIADVSEYVQPESELDKEALLRGCTIYLPDRAIPMLPSALAADLCSLLPERDRLCLCVIAELDREARVHKYEIVEGVMRSAAMLTYGGVARALGFTEAPPRSAQAEALKKELRVMEELTKKLRRTRMNRGALDLDLPEARVQLDPETGAPTDVERRAQDPGVKRAYSMIEELMLLANELVAVWLGKHKAPAVYRVHAPPDPVKLERLGQIAAKLGVEFDFEGMSDPKEVGRFLARIQRHPRRQVLEMMLLRSLKQAVYDINNIGHFGLASKNYVHFTSPIRRYPDVEVHRAVKALLRGHKPDTSPASRDKLQLSATLASGRERAVMDIEREVVDLYRALLMRERIGDVLEGTVTALVGSGAYVSLDSPFVDVLVRFESMGGDRYELSDDELELYGLHTGDRIALGDRIVVAIEDVAILRRTVYARRIPPENVVKLLNEAPRGARGRSAPATARRPSKGEPAHKPGNRKQRPERRERPERAPGRNKRPPGKGGKRHS